MWISPFFHKTKLGWVRFLSVKCPFMVEYNSISGWKGLLGQVVYDFRGHNTVGHFNMGNLPQIHLKLKSSKIIFVCESFFSCEIIIIFHTKHGSDTAMLCAKYNNDLTERVQMDKQVLSGENYLFLSIFRWAEGFIHLSHRTDIRK